MNNDDMLKNFEARMSEKKANKPKLHDFTAEFRIGIKAVNEETAQGTVKIIEQILTQFEDIGVVEGKLK